MATRWEVTRAVRASELKSPSRLIMFVLADVAEVGTAEIPERFTPSLTVLANETGLDRSTVRRHLTLLEESGWVRRLRPSVAAARANGERTRYKLLIPKGFEPRHSVHKIDREPRGTEPQKVEAHSPQVGAEIPQPRGTEPPDLGAENTMGRGTVPLNYRSSYQTDLTDLGGKGESSPYGTQIPDDFKPTDGMRRWAKRDGYSDLVDIDLSTAQFVSHYRSTGARRKSWPDAWQKWIRGDAEKAARRPRQQQPANDFGSNEHLDRAMQRALAREAASA